MKRKNIAAQVAALLIAGCDSDDAIITTTNPLNNNNDQDADSLITLEDTISKDQLIGITERASLPIGVSITAKSTGGEVLNNTESTSIAQTMNPLTAAIIEIKTLNGFDYIQNSPIQATGCSVLTKGKEIHLSNITDECHIEIPESNIISTSSDSLNLTNKFKIYSSTKKKIESQIAAMHKTIKEKKDMSNIDRENEINKLISLRDNANTEQEELNKEIILFLNKIKPENDTNFDNTYYSIKKLLSNHEHQAYSEILDAKQKIEETIEITKQRQDLTVLEKANMQYYINLQTTIGMLYNHDLYLTKNITRAVDSINELDNSSIDMSLTINSVKDLSMLEESIKAIELNSKEMKIADTSSSITDQQTKMLELLQADLVKIEAKIAANQEMVELADFEQLSKEEISQIDSSIKKNIIEVYQTGTYEIESNSDDDADKDDHDKDDHDADDHDEYLELLNAIVNSDSGTEVSSEQIEIIQLSYLEDNLHKDADDKEYGAKSKAEIKTEITAIIDEMLEDELLVSLKELDEIDQIKEELATDAAAKIYSHSYYIKPHTDDAHKLLVKNYDEQEEQVISINMSSEDSRLDVSQMAVNLVNGEKYTIEIALPEMPEQSYLKTLTLEQGAETTSIPLEEIKDQKIYIQSDFKQPMTDINISVTTKDNTYQVDSDVSATIQVGNITKNINLLTEPSVIEKPVSGNIATWNEDADGNFLIELPMPGVNSKITGAKALFKETGLIVEFSDSDINNNKILITKEHLRDNGGDIALTAIEKPNTYVLSQDQKSIDIAIGSINHAVHLETLDQDIYPEAGYHFQWHKIEDNYVYIKVPKLTSNLYVNSITLEEKVSGAIHSFQKEVFSNGLIKISKSDLNTIHGGLIVSVEAKSKLTLEKESDEIQITFEDENQEQEQNQVDIAVDHIVFDSRENKPITFEISSISEENQQVIFYLPEANPGYSNTEAKVANKEYNRYMNFNIVDNKIHVDSDSLAFIAEDQSSLEIMVEQEKNEFELVSPSQIKVAFKNKEVLVNLKLIENELLEADSVASWESITYQNQKGLLITLPEAKTYHSIKTFSFSNLNQPIPSIKSEADLGANKVFISYSDIKIDVGNPESDLTLTLEVTENEYGFDTSTNEIIGIHGEQEKNISINTAASEFIAVDATWHPVTQNDVKGILITPPQPIPLRSLSKMDIAISDSETLTYTYQSNKDISDIFIPYTDIQDNTSGELLITAETQADSYQITDSNNLTANILDEQLSIALDASFVQEPVASSVDYVVSWTVNDSGDGVLINLPNPDTGFSIKEIKVKLMEEGDIIHEFHPENYLIAQDSTLEIKYEDLHIHNATSENLDLMLEIVASEDTYNLNNQLHAYIGSGSYHFDLGFTDATDEDASSFVETGDIQYINETDFGLSSKIKFIAPKIATGKSLSQIEILINDQSIKIYDINDFIEENGIKYVELGIPEFKSYVNSLHKDQQNYLELKAHLVQDVYVVDENDNKQATLEDAEGISHIELIYNDTNDPRITGDIAWVIDEADDSKIHIQLPQISDYNTISSFNLLVGNGEESTTKIINTTEYEINPSLLTIQADTLRMVEGENKTITLSINVNPDVYTMNDNELTAQWSGSEPIKFYFMDSEITNVNNDEYTVTNITNDNQDPNFRDGADITIPSADLGFATKYLKIHTDIEGGMHSIGDIDISLAQIQSGQFVFEYQHLKQKIMDQLSANISTSDKELIANSNKLVHIIGEVVADQYALESIDNNGVMENQLNYNYGDSVRGTGTITATNTASDDNGAVSTKLSISSITDDSIIFDIENLPANMSIDSLSMNLTQAVNVASYIDSENGIVAIPKQLIKDELLDTDAALSTNFNIHIAEDQYSIAGDDMIVQTVSGQQTLQIADTNGGTTSWMEDVDNSDNIVISLPASSDNQTIKSVQLTATSISGQPITIDITDIDIVNGTITVPYTSFKYAASGTVNLTATTQTDSFVINSTESNTIDAQMGSQSVNIEMLYAGNNADIIGEPTWDVSSSSSVKINLPDTIAHKYIDEVHITLSDKDSNDGNSMNLILTGINQKTINLDSDFIKSVTGLNKTLSVNLITADNQYSVNNNIASFSSWNNSFQIPITADTNLTDIAEANFNTINSSLLNNNINVGLASNNTSYTLQGGNYYFLINNNNVETKSIATDDIDNKLFAIDLINVNNIISTMVTDANDLLSVAINLEYEADSYEKNSDQELTYSYGNKGSGTINLAEYNMTVTNSDATTIDPESVVTSDQSIKEVVLGDKLVLKLPNIIDAYSMNSISLSLINSEQEQALTIDSIDQESMEVSVSLNSLKEKIINSSDDYELRFNIDVTQDSLAIVDQNLQITSKGETRDVTISATDNPDANAADNTVNWIGVSGNIISFSLPTMQDGNTIDSVQLSVPSINGDIIYTVPASQIDKQTGTAFVDYSILKSITAIENITSESVEVTTTSSQDNYVVVNENENTITATIGGTEYLYSLTASPVEDIANNQPDTATWNRDDADASKLLIRLPNPNIGYQIDSISVAINDADGNPVSLNWEYHGGGKDIIAIDIAELKFKQSGNVNLTVTAVSDYYNINGNSIEYSYGGGLSGNGTINTTGTVDDTNGGNIATISIQDTDADYITFSVDGLADNMSISSFTMNLNQVTDVMSYYDAVNRKLVIPKQLFKDQLLNESNNFDTNFAAIADLDVYSIDGANLTVDTVSDPQTLTITDVNGGVVSWEELDANNIKITLPSTADNSNYSQATITATSIITGDNIVIDITDIDHTNNTATIPYASLKYASSGAVQFNGLVVDNSFTIDENDSSVIQSSVGSNSASINLTYDESLNLNLTGVATWNDTENNLLQINLPTANDDSYVSMVTLTLTDNDSGAFNSIQVVPTDINTQTITVDESFLKSVPGSNKTLNVAIATQVNQYTIVDENLNISAWNNNFVVDIDLDNNLTDQTIDGLDLVTSTVEGDYLKISLPNDTDTHTMQSLSYNFVINGSNHTLVTADAASINNKEISISLNDIKDIIETEFSDVTDSISLKLNSVYTEDTYTVQSSELINFNYGNQGSGSLNLIADAITATDADGNDVSANAGSIVTGSSQILAVANDNLKLQLATVDSDYSISAISLTVIDGDGVENNIALSNLDLSAMEATFDVASLKGIIKGSDQDYSLRVNMSVNADILAINADNNLTVSSNGETVVISIDGTANTDANVSNNTVNWTQINGNEITFSLPTMQDGTTIDSVSLSIPSSSGNVVYNVPAANIDTENGVGKINYSEIKQIVLMEGVTAETVTMQTTSSTDVYNVVNENDNTISATIGGIDYQYSLSSPATTNIANNQPNTATWNANEADTSQVLIGLPNPNIGYSIDSIIVQAKDSDGNNVNIPWAYYNGSTNVIVIDIEQFKYKQSGDIKLILTAVNNNDVS